jgi:hypothetical protein
VKPRNSSINGPDSSTVADYKRLLQQILESRPSGTRRRLAEALGKNRSFISQITNPNYSVPIPARHIETIFEICHFLSGQKAQFLETYARAHPQRLPKKPSPPARWRELTLRVPDLRDARKNRQLEELLRDVVLRLERLLDERSNQERGHNEEVRQQRRRNPA